ncbi:MAG: SCO family protein [Anaerolineae bacterium]|nr:SCO family protein [Thermoflexales bacterium]MDW8406360.1 SCO family protein [Anaerolineae bacterium]
MKWLKRDSVQLIAAVVGALALTVIFGLLGAFAPNILEAARGTEPVSSPTPGGLRVNHNTPARDFTLTDYNNRPLSLSDLRGKFVLLFFGYTHCPDICPLALGEFKAVKRILGDQAEQVAFVMISVDGSRDTPDVMRRYVQAFDPTFIGLTGDELKVQRIGMDYGVRFARRKPEGTAATYLVDHTGHTYLIDPRGYWRMTYPFQTPPAIIAADITRMMGEVKSAP